MRGVEPATQRRGESRLDRVVIGHCCRFLSVPPCRRRTDRHVVGGCSPQRSQKGSPILRQKSAIKQDPVRTKRWPAMRRTTVACILPARGVATVDLILAVRTIEDRCGSCPKGWCRGCCSTTMTDRLEQSDGQGGSADAGIAADRGDAVQDSVTAARNGPASLYPGSIAPTSLRIDGSSGRMPTTSERCLIAPARCSNESVA